MKAMSNVKKTLTIAVASLVATLSIGIAANAATLLQEIKAHLNKEIKITLNGGPWQATSGNQVLDPITYNGTTYLPVRAVSEALDVPIRYDPATKTIAIGELTDKVPVLSEPYTKVSATITEDATERLIGGTDYGKVILFSKVLHSNSRFQMEPAGKYSKVVLKLAIQGDDTRINIVNADKSEVIKSVLLTESSGIQEIEADIIGVSKLTLELTAERPNETSQVRIIADETYYK